MEVNTSKTLHTIEKHVRSGTKTSVAMKDVISVCERSFPHKDWQRLAKIDFDDDVERLRSWIPRVYKREAPPFVTRGLYFGLCNPGSESGRVWADMYMAMFGQYDPRDAKLQWLWGEDRHYPEVSYARSKALRQIYRIAYADEDEGLGNEAEYSLCLAFGAFAVNALLKNEMVELPVGVVVGFDSGDLMKIGELGKTGFVANKKKMM